MNNETNLHSEAATKQMDFINSFKQHFQPVFEELPTEKDGFDDLIPPKEYTKGINKIIKKASSDLGLKLRRGFLNIDYTLFRENSLVMDAAIEHENDPRRRKYNFKKLVNTNAKLKVLICYYDEDENPDKIINYYRRILPNSTSNFIIMISPNEVESINQFKIEII